MKLDLVDVFAGARLGGNPLAVVRGGEGLSSEAMLALTRWLGFSETTFLLPPDDAAADYRVRIFYPGGELPFAGHPTLGSAYAWMAARGVPAREGVVVQQCGIGLVEVMLDDFGWPDEAGATVRLAFRAPPMIRSGALTAEERAAAVSLLGINDRCVVDAVHAVNGPPWQLLRLRAAADVLSARGYAKAQRAHTDIGLIGPWEAGDVRANGAGWEVRGFFSNAGRVMVEDPVTGSLNAAVALYLYERGLETGDYVAAQGRCVGAEGRVYVSRDAGGPDGIGAWIGGDVAMVAAGAVLAPL